MKYCPVCDERFDEDIIRFCTKDGTPLVEDEAPRFTEMPSQGTPLDDDIGEQTVIRRKGPVSETQLEDELAAERFVISTTPPEAEQRVRPRAPQAYYPPPPPEQNTFKVVVLTILGTLIVLGFGAGLFWLLQKESPKNTNVNVNLANQNANLNTNLAFDSNFNFNMNANFNSNSSSMNANFNFNALNNLNTNVNAAKSPTPTPSPKPSPSLAPSPSPEASPTAAPPTPKPTVDKPWVTPTPRTGPRPSDGLSNRPVANRP